MFDKVFIVEVPTTLNIGNDTIFCSGDSTQLNFTSNSLFTSYQWSPSSSLSCINCKNPFAKPNKSTKYYLIASTIDGCTNMDSITINILDLPNNSDALTNSFSPNNDGINDVFKLNNLKILNCKIYNKWGNLIVEYSNFENGWDGKTSKGLNCLDGIYYYLALTTNECGKEVNLNGFIQLIR